MPLGKKRQHCAKCQRPERRCLCHLAVEIPLPWRLVVWQDPSEIRQAKGTVPLLQACLPQLDVWNSADSEEQLKLERLLDDPHCGCFLVYPGPDARTVADIRQVTEANPTSICFILLDATWRKSLKLLHSHPRLTQLPRVGLQHLPTSRYHIRKSPRRDGVSTLEAAATLLAEWHAMPPAQHPASQRLLAQFQQWVEEELARLPTDIRQRYPASEKQE